MSEFLKEKVTKLLGLRAALAFSRGSAGLYALLVAIAKRSGSGEVIVPTLCCETVALAAIYAGHSVRFADISPETLCATPETVAPLITSRTRAVIIVHLYGMDAQADSFSALRLKYPNLAFVEDIAHAFGGYDKNGRLLGGSLDYTLVSFADSKIVPGDGGMLLFGSGLLEPEDLLAEIPLDALRKPKPRAALSMRNLVHAIADLWREEMGKRGPPIFLDMLDKYKSLIVSPGGIADEKAAIAGINKFQTNRETRYNNYLFYRTGIASKSVMIPYFHDGSTCWRCPLVFESASKATIATEALRAVGIPVSNHYFPLSVLFDTQTCPHGEDIALRIVNLWTDERMLADTIKKSVNIINRI